MSTFTQTGPALAVTHASPPEDWPAGMPAESDLPLATAPSKNGRRSSADLRLVLLARTIENEIIPRLMLAHRTTDEVPSKAPALRRIPPALDVERFAKMVLTRDTDVSFAFLETLLAQGIALETVYIDLLAPVARYMGELWEEDLCDFTEVTIGLGRLHHLLRSLSPAFGEVVGQLGNGRRILLLPSPGEQHTFGLSMVSEFFRRAAWDVSGGPSNVGADPVTTVKHEWFDIVGFSLGAEQHLDDLSECIQAVRKASLNEHVGIMVGGPIFSQCPQYVVRVGADIASSDGSQAPALAEQLSAKLKKGL